MKTDLRWGILGPGWIAEKFATALKHVPKAELFAVGSRSGEKARLFARRFGFQKWYGSYEDLAADPDVDVVYVATPHPMHCENTLRCLNAGKAVLCEKPFAMNEQEVRRMVDAARANSTFLMEAMWSRFHPSTMKAMNLIQSGAIGEIVHAPFSDLGFRAAINPEGRLFNPELGGGSLLDVGVYPVFIALLLLGEPDEIETRAILTERGIDSSLSAVFKYRKGQLANLFSSVETETATETEIAGTSGRILMHTKWFMPEALTVTALDGSSERYEFPVLCNGYESEAMEVTRCVQDGLTESELMPHEFSLKLIRLLDTLRRLNGIVYPADSR